MIKDTSYQVIDTSDGVVMGEITSTPELDYLEKGALVVLADGLDKFLDMLVEKMPKPKKGESSVASGRDNFNAFSSYQEAMDTFRGAPEKISDFDPAEIRIRDESESGSVVDYDVTGDYIDMGRYLEGIPESWGSMHGGQARNRRATIVVNLNNSAGMGHETIKHRAERTLRLVDALEAGGIRCELKAISSTQCDHVEITIKQHAEPLTIQDLAVVTHPEFLRRALFRVKEHSKTWDWNYGWALKFGDSITPELLDNGNNDELDIFIDGDIRNVDEQFDKLERLVQWEMSKPVPEVTSIKLDKYTLQFNPNGYRSSEEIRREGQEVINER